MAVKALFPVEWGDPAATFFVGWSLPRFDGAVKHEKPRNQKDSTQRNDSPSLVHMVKQGANAEKKKRKADEWKQYQR